MVEYSWLISHTSKDGLTNRKDVRAMPFSEKTHVLHAVDCSGATVDDRVGAELSDGSSVVLRLVPELADGLEHDEHVRLHLDRVLSPLSIIEALEQKALPSLIQFLPRKQKRRVEPSMISFFCWADDYRLWSGDRDFELVAWLQLPGEPVNFYRNGPISLKAPLEQVEFFATLPR